MEQMIAKAWARLDTLERESRMGAQHKVTKERIEELVYNFM